MNRNGSNSISCSFDAFKRDRAGEVGCLRQMKMAATLFFFLDRRFTLRKFAVILFVVWVEKNNLFGEFVFLFEFQGKFEYDFACNQNGFNFYFRLVLILFSILQYFSRFLFFLSGLAVKRIRYLYFANSFFDLFLNRNIINLDEFEIKDSSSFELVLFKSTYFRKTL